MLLAAGTGYSNANHGAVRVSAGASDVVLNHSYVRVAPGGVTALTMTSTRLDAAQHIYMVSTQSCKLDQHTYIIPVFVL